VIVIVTPKIEKWRARPEPWQRLVLPPRLALGASSFAGKHAKLLHLGSEKFENGQVQFYT
jgi:hypothetical protein